MEQLAHRARHPGFALDLLDVGIPGVLVRPVQGAHRVAERLRGCLPVAVMIALAMRARVALPGEGLEFSATRSFPASAGAPAPPDGRDRRQTGGAT